MKKHNTCTQLAGFFKFFSNPLRLKIICCVSQGERTITEIVEFTGATKFNVSQQIRILKLAQVLTLKKKGKFVYCKLKDKKLHSCLQTMSKLAPSKLTSSY